MEGKGEWFECLGPAGGGYGNPLEREPEAVLDDVLDELITRDIAETEYGVIITPDLTIDTEATRRRRAVG